MLRLIKYRCIQLLREKVVMFWGTAFPVILGTMFHLALANLGEMELNAIPVAVVAMDRSEQSKQFQNFVNNATDILDVTLMDEAMAIQYLEDGEIEGIYKAGTTHKLIVTKSSLNTSILQTVLETYQNNEHIIMEIIQTQPENIGRAMEEMADYKSMTRNVDLSGARTNTAMIYFLALIGMACLYGTFLGVHCAMHVQANLSAVGARRSVAAMHRLQLVLADMLTTFGIHFANILVLLFYLRVVLRVDLGDNLGALVLASAVGSMLGVAIGIFVGSFSKIEEKMKVSIVLGVSMVCSFLAGLMMGNMKDIIERHVPIINRINPAALISDAFYALTIYPDMARYYRNILILSGMSIVLVGVSFLRVRREKYDSI